MKQWCEKWMLEALVDLLFLPPFVNMDEFYKKYPQLKQHDLHR